MIEKLETYKKQLDDLSGKIGALQQYMQSGHLTAVTPNNASQYLELATKGFGVASLYYAQTIELFGRIDAALDMTRSIAFLDKASTVLNKTATKDSAEARKQTVSNDPDVIEALEMRAKAEGLMTFFKSKAIEFRMNYDAVKKLGFGDNFNTVGGDSI